jgi:hypothetical protein
MESDEFKPFSLAETLKVNETLSAKKALERAIAQNQTLNAYTTSINSLSDAQRRAIRNEIAHGPLDSGATANAVLILEAMRNENYSPELFDLTAFVRSHGIGANELAEKKSFWNSLSKGIKKQLEAVSLAGANETRQLSEVEKMEKRRLDHVTFSLNEMKNASEIARRKMVLGD